MDEVVEVKSLLRSAPEAGVEHGGEAAHIGAERGPWFIAEIDVPDARRQQRAVLHLAQAVPHR
jgi:hypothetical protein